MTDSLVYTIPSSEPMMHHLSEAADTLLQGGIVEAGKLVYLPRQKEIGYEIQTSGGHWLASVRTKSADASNVAQGGMVEIDADARAKGGTPYTQDSIMQGLLLLLQYMTHKAYIKKDVRFAEAAQRWEATPIEDRSSYRMLK